MVEIIEDNCLYKKILINKPPERKTSFTKKVKNGMSFDPIKCSFNDEEKSNEKNGEGERKNIIDFTKILDKNNIISLKRKEKIYLSSIRNNQNTRYKEC